MPLAGLTVVTAIDFPKFRFKYLTISLLIGIWLLLTSRPIAVAQDRDRRLGFNAYRRASNLVYPLVRLDGCRLLGIAAEQKKDDEDHLGLETIPFRRAQIENRFNSQLQLDNAI